jgi:flagellar biosynthesis protein FlhG
MTTKTQKPSTKDTSTARAQKLFAVASGKGGVGKTWFSITLSHALAKAGKKVLLFDGDLGLANIDVQLGIMTKHDINDVIEGNLTLERIIQHHAEGGFDVIAGRSGHGALAMLPGPRLNEILEQLRGLQKNYDAVIVDLGAGIDRTVRFMMAAADAAFVVMTDEPTSLTDAYALIKLCHGAGHGANLHVVVNMSGSVKEGEGSYGTLTRVTKEYLKFTPPLLGIIRQDKRVRDAIRAQGLFLTRNPNTETSADVEKIAASIQSGLLTGLLAK